MGTNLIVLDEQGHDRFRVGDMLPAAPGFHRVGSAYGVSILDTQGGERGGMGFISNGSNVNRAVVALDRLRSAKIRFNGFQRNVTLLQCVEILENRGRNNNSPETGCADAWDSGR